MHVSRPLQYCLAYLFPATLPLLCFWGSYWTFLPAFCIYVLVPLIDAVLGEDTYNMESDERSSRDHDYAFRLVAILWVPYQYAFLIGLAWWISVDHLTTLELIGLTLSAGTLNGASFVVSHELCHSLDYFEKFLGQALLATSCYMHFAIEHVYGHHKNVATPLDPASSRLGESLYSFIPRTVIGSYKNAWKIQMKNLITDGKPFLSPSNHMLLYTIIPSVMVLVVWRVFGTSAVLFWCAQSVIAFLTFETINYVEHYGLERQHDVTSGKYVAVNQFHSWNANTSLTNALLLKIQRHSDHHTHSLKPYHILLHIPSTPMLPCGYAPMLLLSLVPPLWFHVMDPLAHKFNQEATWHHQQQSQ